MQPLPDGKFSPPASCPGCRAKALVPMRHGAATRDLQKVRLQELPDEGASSSASAGERGGDADFFGRVPRTVEVELLDELADCCVPGDALQVCGIVKSVEVAAEGAGAFRGAASNKPRCMYLLYIEAVSAENTKAHAGGGTDAGGERADAGLALSAADLHGIADVAAEPNLLQLLSLHSARPSSATRSSRPGWRSGCLAARRARGRGSTSRSGRTSTCSSWATPGWASRRC